MVKVSEMPDFDNNGAKIHYELVGSGPPLLMIAGLASDGASWGPLTPMLAERYRVILIDNRGSGRTKAEGPLSVAEMVGDAVALLDHLKIAEAFVVGHSLGGYIGLSLAAKHPQRVKRLVTLCSGASDPKRRILLADLAKLYFMIPPEQWFRLLYQWLFSAPFFAKESMVIAAAQASTLYPHRQSPGDFARQVAAVERGDDFHTRNITAPVLAVAADLDLLAPATAVDELHFGIRDLTREDVPGAAHSIHWEQPGLVAEIISDTLR